MLEWIAFWKSLGIDHFLVFTNDCEDGTDSIARRLEDLGIASHVDNRLAPGDSPQNRMFRKVRHHPRFHEADWAICADADEFLNLDPRLSGLRGWIEAVETRAGGPVDAISVAWRLFGCGGNVAYRDEPVTRQFQWADRPVRFHSGRASGLKTLFRNNGRFTRYGPHRPKGMDPEALDEIRWSDASGNLFPARDIGWRAWDGFQHDLARLHHYAVRSVESFLVKRDRGRTNHIHADQAEGYWRAMNANHRRDTSIAVWAERAEPERLALMGDQELGRLHEEAVAWHRGKIDELSARDGWQDFKLRLARNAGQLAISE